MNGNVTLIVNKNKKNNKNININKYAIEQKEV